eukprot:50218-Lingulodinium_polyedra.AAC.1
MEAPACFRSNTGLAELVTTVTGLVSSSSRVHEGHVKGQSSHPWNDLADAAAGGQASGLTDI